MTVARVVVFGGYGAVGREAAAVLSSSHDVVVAGRNPPATVPGATAVRVDLRGDVTGALDGADAVLMCAEVDNARIARACLDRGVHYLDVTASHGTVAAIGALEGDATALLSVGLAPGVTNLLARHCVELTGARDVEIGVLLGGGERHGAAAVAWTLDGLADLGPSWRVEFPAPYGTRTVHGFPFSDQRTLPDTLGVDRVRTGLCLDSRLVTALLPAAARFAHRLGPLAKAHVGGDGFAVAVSAGGVTCAFSGRRQSRATGVVAALLVDRLPALPPGVWHVDQVVDPVPFLTEVAAHGFDLHLPPTMHPDGTATSSSTA
ncbi:saccharopine dehydrogenase NADP-binding domain-containing protein [Actinosynnema sp. NPDC049800]